MKAQQLEAIPARIPRVTAGRVRLVPTPAGWRGVRVSTQAEADARVPLLLGEKADVRFVWCEPVEAVDLRRVDLKSDCPKYNALRGLTEFTMQYGPKLDWLIVSGQCGPTARPMHPQWVRSLRDQATAAGVAFLFVGWGRWAPGWNEEHFTHCGEEKHAHAWIDSRTGESGRCWIVDDDGSWSNWTGDPEMQESGLIADQIEVMGDFRSKRAAGRLLDGSTHDQTPQPTRTRPA